MRITKVYTRTGDKGTTRLVGGQVVPKNHARIEAYGTVDELNAILGLCRVAWGQLNDDAARPRLDAFLLRVQNDLFNVGADLATLPEDRWETMVRVTNDDATRLEGWIDALNADLEPLKEFILPGGGPVSASFHQARTVCRRAERAVATLLNHEPETGMDTLRYLNRLSDFLFVAGRWAAKAAREPEVLWKRTPED